MAHVVMRPKDKCFWSMCCRWGRVLGVEEFEAESCGVEGAWLGDLSSPRVVAVVAAGWPCTRWEEPPPPLRWLSRASMVAEMRSGRGSPEVASGSADVVSAEGWVSGANVGVSNNKGTLLHLVAGEENARIRGEHVCRLQVSITFKMADD